MFCARAVAQHVGPASGGLTMFPFDATSKRFGFLAMNFRPSMSLLSLRSKACAPVHLQAVALSHWRFLLAGDQARATCRKLSASWPA